MIDFFISYNQADRQWAEWVAWQLKEAGYTVTLQAWDFRPGSNFIIEMHRAAREAQRTIAVLSPDYLTAQFPQPEWAAALARDPLGEKGALLPVRVRKCDIEGRLGPIVYIDLIELDEAIAKQALLDGVRREPSSPQQAPTFPAPQPQTILSKPRFPGALPATCNLPHLRNSNFTGREAELAELRASLHEGEAVQLGSNETARLLSVGGVYLQARAEYTQAKKMLERALAIDEAALGSDHPKVAIRLNNLGNVLREQGDLDSTKALFERSLRIVREYLGDDHPHTKLVQGHLQILEAELGNTKP
jgi:tetratricopeptide (TPR) repeat protein